MTDVEIEDVDFAGMLAVTIVLVIQVGELIKGKSVLTAFVKNVKTSNEANAMKIGKKEFPPTPKEVSHGELW